jgi:putative mRNA 3-end processing factor
LSLHPAGHILGSAQVRCEYQGEVAVVTGDYKCEPDPTTTPFEPLRCHTFVTESTFALPIFRWEPQSDVADQINAWWRQNQAAGRASLLMGYSLGKSQRLLSCLDVSIGPVFQHGAVETMTDVYRSAGVSLPETRRVPDETERFDWSKAMIVAPPGSDASPWARRFGDVATAFASGWMALRSWRHRSNVDQGFVLSDHADWRSLIETVHATGAEEVWITHGYAAVLARYLREQGIHASVLGDHSGREEGAAHA